MKNYGVYRARALVCVAVAVLGMAAKSSQVEQGRPSEADATVHSGQPAQLAGRQLDWCEVIEVEPDAEVVTDAALREAIKKTGLPWRVRHRGTAIEMLLVPPGKFVMGKAPGDDEARSNELPAHEVELTEPFYLGRYEVTKQEYARMTGEAKGLQSAPPGGKSIAAFMAEGYTKDEAERMFAEQAAAVSPAPDRSVKGQEMPVEGVSWTACQSHLFNQLLRLPTEAEWEFACQAGVRQARYGALDEVAWCDENSDGHAHLVGTKAANRLGFSDMLGNVFEWVNDWYEEYPSDPQTNPVGQNLGAYRVFRGGSWNYKSVGCRGSCRTYGHPTNGYGHVGFRAARNP